MNKQISGVLLLSLLAASCNSEAPVEANAESETIQNYQLAITDSYGVETGDSLEMIGRIDAFSFHPDGSILILDQAAMCIRKVKNGNVQLIGREGSGPGEFLLPISMCALGNGTILVGDESRREVMEFDSAGDYTGILFSTDMYAPKKMFPAGSSSFTGKLYEIEFADNQAIFTMNFGLFDSTPEPVVTYLTRQWTLPDPGAYADIFIMDCMGSPDGTFYSVWDNTEYSISVYSPDGEQSGTISCPDVSRLPKTEREIADEIEEFETYAVNDRSYTGGYEPCPYHTLIALAGVDAEGNLWVERKDVEEGFLFDVWDSSGNLLYTASFNELERGTEAIFHVDAYGILAAVTDPELFPRVLVLELQP